MSLPLSLAVIQMPVFSGSFLSPLQFPNSSLIYRIIVNSVNAQNPVWLSIVALSALFLIDFTGKLLTARRDFYSFRIYFNLRSVLTTAIFDKVFWLACIHVNYPFPILERCCVFRPLVGLDIQLEKY
jgi:hypothetical protein